MWGKHKSQKPKPGTLRLEAYGVCLELRCAPPSLLEIVQPILPPGWRERPGGQPAATLTLAEGGEAGLDVVLDGAPVIRGAETKLALGVLDSRIRAAIAGGDSQWVFIHAGVVEHDGQAILIPGKSFAGKTTLVRALIENGARYFSDEYAVLDADGWVHPYPRRLSIRIGGSRRDTDELSARELGAETGDEKARVGLVVNTSYNPEATWDPQEGSTADAALALLENAVLARSAPQRVMSAISRTVAEARLLEGERGQAQETAAMLLGAAVG
jgi:hypothetical protein